MAKNLLILGPSGNGKTTSARNLDPKTTFIIAPNSKALPWKGSAKQYNAENKNYTKVSTLVNLRKALLQINTKFPHIKTVIIDDLFHYILQKTMADMKVPGYAKYKELAQEIYRVTGELEDQIRDDLRIVYITHTEEVISTDGSIQTKLKLTGKFTEEVTDIPSFFTYVFEAKVKFENDESQYVFLTNKASKADLAKSPMGCFKKREVPNDLQEIITTINKYEQGE